MAYVNKSFFISLECILYRTQVMTHIEVYKIFEDILQLVQFVKYGSSIVSL